MAALAVAPSAPRRSSPTAHVVTVERHAIVGRLIDWQILAGYAFDAIGAAHCPENSAAVDVARQALAQLQDSLRAETGRLEGMER